MNNYTNIKLYVSYFISILAFLTFSLLIIDYTYNIDYFKVNKLIITGNNFIDDTSIEEIINESVLNKNISEINLINIKSNINKHPYINSSKIYTVLPSILTIRIQEINPIGLCEKNEKIYLIDYNSNLIESNTKAINYFKVPIVIDYNGNEDIDYKKFAQLLKTIVDNNKNLFNEINEIRYNNNYITILLSNKTNIKINKNNSKKEMQTLFQFIKAIKNKRELMSYEYIDLTVNNQIIVKEKKIKI